MNRRDYLKRQVAGPAILAASGLVHHASAQNLPSADPDQPDVLDVDVLVVGGGSAGHVAAIQAGRLGARTVLLERNSQLGGTTTTVECADFGRVESGFCPSGSTAREPVGLAADCLEDLGRSAEAADYRRRVEEAEGG